VVLFASERSLTFKGLYRLQYEEDGLNYKAPPPEPNPNPSCPTSPTAGQVSKVYGTGPATLNSEQVFKYYKYNSAAKTFDLMTTKTFGLTVDGMALPPAKTSRPTSARRARPARGPA
jgi:hypothetical protein